MQHTRNFKSASISAVHNDNDKIWQRTLPDHLLQERALYYLTSHQKSIPCVFCSELYLVHKILPRLIPNYRVLHFLQYIHV